MKHSQRRHDSTVVAWAWIGGLCTFAFVNFAPLTVRATVVGTFAVAGGVWATRYYLTRPPKTHPVNFNNGALQVKAVIVNSPYDEDETQRRVAGIAHTLVACVSRPKHVPRAATHALKSINDAQAAGNGQDAKTEPPIVISVPDATEKREAISPSFHVVDEDDRDAMEVVDFDEPTADILGKCTTCDNDAKVLLEGESDDGRPQRQVYCGECAEVVQCAIDSTCSSPAAG